MMNKNWMSVTMLQECIEGKRVLLHGLYEAQDGVRVTPVQMVSSGSTVYVAFEEVILSDATTPWESLSVKKFTKKYKLVGV